MRDVSVTITNKCVSLVINESLNAIPIEFVQSSSIVSRQALVLGLRVVRKPSIVQSVQLVLLLQALFLAQVICVVAQHTHSLGFFFFFLVQTTATI